MAPNRAKRLIFLASFLAFLEATFGVKMFLRMFLMNITFGVKLILICNNSVGLHDIAGLTKVSSQSFVKFGIINILLFGSALMVLWISLKQVGFESRKIVFQTSFYASK